MPRYPPSLQELCSDEQDPVCQIARHANNNPACCRSRREVQLGAEGDEEAAQHNGCRDHQRDQYHLSVPVGGDGPDLEAKHQREARLRRVLMHSGDHCADWHELLRCIIRCRKRPPSCTHKEEVVVGSLVAQGAAEADCENGYDAQSPADPENPVSRPTNVVLQRDRRQ